MSRDYGRVYTSFWKSAAIRSVSDQARLLATYLLSGPHSNAIGAYLLPNAYIADDLNWSTETVSQTLSELFRIGFAKRFSDGRHIVVCKFLEWNPIENPNVAKAALKQAEQLPDDPAIQYVIDGFKLYSKHFANGFETLSKRLGEPFRNIEPEPEPEPEQEQEPEQDLARSADADARTAFEAYNQLAEDVGWPKAQLLTPRRRSAFRARFREIGGLEGWRAAMAKARASPFLRGESGRDKAHQSWAPDLDFFLQQSSLTKLMEGKYDQRSSNQQPQGFDAIREGARRAAGLDRSAGPSMDSPSDQIQRLALSAGSA